MVEHTLGKGGVVSPILTSGTIKQASFMEAFFNGLRIVRSGLTGARVSPAPEPRVVEARKSER